MQGRLNEALDPGVVIEVRATLPTNPAPERKLLLLLEVAAAYESHMRDGILYDLVVLNSEGGVERMMIHEKEIDGQAWFASRRLKFNK